MRSLLLRTLGAAACALTLAGSAAALAEGVRWPYPLPETGIVIGRWLERSGFEVRRWELPEGGTRLEGRRGEQDWNLALRPCSALATCVESVSVVPATLAEPWEKALERVLERYARDGSQAPPLPRVPIPAAVLARRPSVVCLLSHGPDGPRQSSGFAVDGAGTVLTTAHGLEGADTVTVVWPGGGRVPGHRVRTDPEEDLALFRTGPVPGGNGFGPHVETLNARLAVGEGDPVYAVGCTAPGETTVREGRLLLPMRRMGTAVLWEVDLPTPPGSSGSPLFDGEGRLSGVVRGRLKADETRGFVIPAQTVLRFLGRPDAR
ncbi:MAG: serine protease [Thermodesulfobacteriota bacterium]